MDMAKMEPLAAGFQGDQALERVRQPEAPAQWYAPPSRLSLTPCAQEFKQHPKCFLEHSSIN